MGNSEKRPRAKWFCIVYTWAEEGAGTARMSRREKQYENARVRIRDNSRKTWAEEGAGTARMSRREKQYENARVRIRGNSGKTWAEVGAGTARMRVNDVFAHAS